MKKTIQTEKVLTTGKAVYEKPAMQVYELEVEGAILQASAGTTINEYGYDGSVWN